MIQIILNIVYSTSVYLVLSKSFHIYYVTHRFFNIAQSISIILGAYLVFLFVRETSYPFWVSIFFSVVLCVLVMWTAEKIVYLPLGNRSVEGWRMMLVSLGINVVFLNIIEMIWGSGMLSFKTWGTSVGVSIGDAYLSTVQLWSLGACAFLSILWGVIENHTMLGMKIKATSSSKNKVVYRKFNIAAGISLAIQGLLPVAAYLYVMYANIDWQWLLFAPAIVMYFLYLLIWNRLRGYTGDCCGALCLIIELTTLLVVSTNVLF